MNRIKFLIIILTSILLSACEKNNDETDKDSTNNNLKAIWINNAFETLESGNFSKIKAVSWWNENFDNSFLKINTSEQSLQAYRNGVKSGLFITEANFVSNKLLPAQNGIYHSAFPDFGGTEDVVSEEKIQEFENLAEKQIVWAYFSNNWYNNIRFPSEEVNIIHQAGKIPFIRIMPRTNFDEGGPDSNYTMQKIIDGEFDSLLVQWAENAANTPFPLLVEFGTEVNGNWFPWNGQYNGADEKTLYGDTNLYDGAERFRDAYRHIVDICNNAGAGNITWFFHVDAYDEPETDWNKLENYYPGDNYVDWIGVSIYGPQQKGDEYQEFSEILNDVYFRLENISNKPIAVLEFAVTEMN